MKGVCHIVMDSSLLVYLMNWQLSLWASPSLISQLRHPWAALIQDTLFKAVLLSVPLGVSSALCNPPPPQLLLLCSVYQCHFCATEAHSLLCIQRVIGANLESLLHACGRAVRATAKPYLHKLFNTNANSVSKHIQCLTLSLPGRT